MKILFFKKPKNLYATLLAVSIFIFLFLSIIISQVRNVHFLSESVSAKPQKEFFVTLTPTASWKGDAVIYLDGEEYAKLEGKQNVEVTKGCTLEILSRSDDEFEVKIDLMQGLDLIPDCEKIEIKKGINYIGRIIFSS